MYNNYELMDVNFKRIGNQLLLINKGETLATLKCIIDENY
uniref:Uncharacterized protein n=1 Tax=Tetranychus urticae TaxID=32264 RepID=T1L359_TETUR